jgi:predicted nucleic acid-binding protein
MQETISLITRKADHPSRPKLAKLFVEDVLKPLCKIYPDGPALFEQALAIHARTKYSYYDSLIIAAALEADCTTLYSEDLHHGQKIGKLHITNPFQ